MVISQLKEVDATSEVRERWSIQKYYLHVGGLLFMYIWLVVGTAQLRTPEVACVACESACRLRVCLSPAGLPIAPWWLSGEATPSALWRGISLRDWWRSLSGVPFQHFVPSHQILLHLAQLSKF